MKIMITGGTGFVGYHTARLLHEQGHQLSLLVRSEKKMRSLFGADEVERFTVGDVTDPDAVARAVEGCDGLVHSAAMVSTKAADADLVYETNVGGTRNVMEAARRSEVGAIVHVSSVTALYNPRASILDERSPPGNVASGYGRSKAVCERYVRELQDDGMPIYITYPASVVGPDDPGLTESLQGMQTYLTQFVPLLPTGNQYVDVRDCAEVHRRLLEGEAAPGRFLLGGHYLSWPELGATLDSLTGRKLKKVRLGGVLLRAAGQVFDRVSPYLNLELPLTAEGAGYASRWVKMDNGAVERELGFEFRPVEDTLADTIVWLQQEGHISARQAGRLAQ